MIVEKSPTLQKKKNNVITCRLAKRFFRPLPGFALHASGCLATFYTEQIR